MHNLLPELLHKDFSTMSLADQHAALLAQLHSSRPAGLSVSPSRMHGSASGGPSYMGATHSSRARTTTLSAALGPASPTPSFAGSAARSPGRDFIAVPEGGSFQVGGCVDICPRPPAPLVCLQCAPLHDVRLFADSLSLSRAIMLLFGSPARARRRLLF